MLIENAPEQLRVDIFIGLHNVIFADVSFLLILFVLRRYKTHCKS